VTVWEDKFALAVHSMLSCGGLLLAEVPIVEVHGDQCCRALEENFGT